MSGKIKIAALTGGVKTPASRFRIRQYISRLASHNIFVHEYIPFFHENCGLPSPFKAVSHLPGVVASHKADLSWIGRELVQGYETFERWLKKPCVMDVDDAIWLDWPLGKYAIPHLARQMAAIVAGNSYLADWFGKYCKKIYILPTAIDIERYAKRQYSIAAEKEKFTIGWTGLACNYQFLKLIEQPLFRFLKDYPDSELMLIAEKPWKKTIIPADRIRFVRWSQQTEASSLQEMSVGLMPLPDNEWTRGKCSFKMLQYMAVGLPVIVSPVGMNNEILAKGQIGFAPRNSDEWYESLEILYNNRKLQLTMGDTARQIVEQYFSVDKTADQLAGIFKSLV